MAKDYSKLFDTKHLQGDLKKRSLKSGAVTLTSQGMMFVIQLASTMILARILTPDDYGMMAMVVSITGLAAILNNLGLSMATVQRAEITHEQVSTLFWINVGVGTLVTLIVASLSPVVAWFYQTPELVWMMLVLSCNFFINGLGVQHSALLSRQMRFLSLAKIQVFSALLGIGTAIVAAKYGFGYWALVLNSVVLSLAGVIGTWLTVRWIPGRPRRDSEVLSMVKFGTDIVGFNIINYFARNLDNILIGRFHGSGGLGLYSKAYQLLMMPISNLRDPMTRVAMPALSRLQNDPGQYRNYYMKFISILAFVSMPLVAFLFVCSDQIIGLLLGSQWLGASAIFRILAIAAFIQPVSTTWGLILLSTGKSRRYFRWGVVNSIIISISFGCGLAWGAKGVASAYTIATYLLLYPTLAYAMAESPVKIYDFFISIAKPVLGSLGMGVGCWYLLNMMNQFSQIIVVAACLVFCGFAYLFFIVLFSFGFNDLKEYFSYSRVIFSKK